MSKENNIPENDPDLIMARQYGNILSEDITPSEIKNPFLNVLLKTRAHADKKESKIQVSGQEHTWDKIQKSISGSERRKSADIHILSSAKKWYLVAAAVILIAFSSILYLQQTLDPAPQLIAESGSSVSIIELADGSSVTLRPNSRLFALSVTDNSHNYALSGEALFDVETSTERIFTVESGPGRVVVTGTRFNLNDRNQQSAVYLIEGSVLFESFDKQQSVNLTSGQAAVIDQENRLLDPFSFDPDEITGWTDDRLTFRDRLTESILSELEFHFNITIEAPEEIKQVTLGGSISLESAEQSLGDLGAVLGGRFEQTGEATYQFRMEP